MRCGTTNNDLRDLYEARRGYPTTQPRRVVDNRELADNSPTIQPRRVVDNRQLNIPHAVFKESTIASTSFTFERVIPSDCLASE